MAAVSCLLLLLGSLHADCRSRRMLSRHLLRSCRHQHPLLLVVMDRQQDKLLLLLVHMLSTSSSRSKRL